jgi:hypothetical protein
MPKPLLCCLLIVCLSVGTLACFARPTPAPVATPTPAPAVVTPAPVATPTPASKPTTPVPTSRPALPTPVRPAPPTPAPTPTLAPPSRTPLSADEAISVAKKHATTTPRNAEEIQAARYATEASKNLWSASSLGNGKWNVILSTDGHTWRWTVYEAVRTALFEGRTAK